MSTITELFCRQPRAVELIHGHPEYSSVTEFEGSREECRIALYSKNGSRFAFTQPKYVIVADPNDGSVTKKLELPEVFDLHFSPLGNYLCMWLKPVKDAESGNFNNNVQVYDIQNDAIIGSYSNKSQAGWKPQFTADEKLITRATSNGINFFELTNLNFDKPLHKLKVENYANFELSPGLNPAVAVFTPEKKGLPASVKVYNIPSFSQPICQKTFFKSERCQLRWNSLGTALLALASTDVDSSNKSYYGETNLYLLGIAGAYDSRITLDREGPIHDITWSPSSREFAVVYGFMPATTSFFDARGNNIHTLPPAPRNTILFSPHAKFVLVAGFGNLQGTVDVYDRQNKFAKITTFEAANTSVCHWSPCGRFILTATTAPRLRVDNGLKVWHASGKLIYMKDYKELYSIAWRPQDVSIFPALKKLDEAPAPHESVVAHMASKPQAAAASKPAGAYRPPHARRNGDDAPAAPTSLYQREILSSSSVNNVSSYQAPRQKIIPGAPAPVVQESKAAAKNRKKREAKKNETPEPVAAPVVQEEEKGAVVGGVASLEEKKIRSLLKKLRAIESLKMKQAKGEPLEDTQVLKINNEDTIRGELATLGWSE
ncbi:hypothetical protein BABINDRAFT_5182 [Babjeviella inositovora NRRL Y-12698]|uniref:Eukaryotic translation initiation factor 2A n=1 Tax=Babjeviella inositovora NRRL Y-12698 TaxID=984486 RepID=A0A1E3QWW7_9ASCO|nr:uncharacterized protein BABINDRAFT_5182 [Babjeviella inositovora NRRL Y-12698]ODQ82178.1 hypothetical protein BABINDRAFT_5182 [Babjeviella inositovora NRRL Y-12698]